jgi:hypothetical protein
MATFLDIGLAQHFSVVFTVLLVFVLIFAVLEKTKMFGEKKGIHSLIALCIALMMLFVPGIIQVVAIMAPWFVLIFLLIIFFYMLLLAFGVSWDKIMGYTMKEWDTPHWFLLIIGLVIFIGALGAVYGGAMLPYSQDKAAAASSEGVSSASSAASAEQGTTTDTGDFNQNVGRVIFHPKTLGIVFLLMVGSLAIRLLAGAKP